MSDNMDLFLGRQAVAPSDREWSEQQQALFEEVMRGKGNVAVEARAGSGKTTSALEAARRVPSRRSLITAFNKSIAEELKKRAPPGLDVKTLHAAGYGILKQHDRACTIDADKGMRLAREVVGASAPQKFATAVKKAAAIFKANLVEDRLIGAAVLDTYDIEAEPYASQDELAQLGLRAMNAAKEMTGLVDFDDQVWLPAALGLKSKFAYELVFVDELQDMNEAQLSLVLSMTDALGRNVVIGDPKQAIYGWRGAGVGMYDKIVERLDAKRLPLTTTYRCPLSVVREANAIVPDLRARPGAPEGKVERIDTAQMRRAYKPGDVVLSRLNAALVAECVAAIRLGMKANITGRDLGAALQAMAQRAHADSVDELVAWTEAWKAKEVEKRHAKDQDPQPVIDKAECLLAFCDGMASVGQVLRNIAVMFDDVADKDRVTFSSVHRYKGLENERVFMLDDTFLRPRPKTDPETGRKDWVVTPEEFNVKYVALTRSSSELYLVKGPSVREP